MFRYGESAAPLLTKKKHEMHVTLKYKAPKLPKKMGAFKPCDACIKALENFFFLYSYLLPMLCKLKSGLSLRFLSCRVNTTSRRGIKQLGTSPSPKRQLVRYPNHETMGNNDIQ